MTALPERPGELPRLEYAIPCRRFDNQDASPSIDGILEAAELVRAGRLQFQLAVKLFAPAGAHRLEVTPISPKGERLEKERSTVGVAVQEPAWGERLAVPLSFPCETVGWWLFELSLDGHRLGESHLWVQFALP